MQNILSESSLLSWKVFFKVYRLKSLFLDYHYSAVIDAAISKSLLGYLLVSEEWNFWTGDENSYESAGQINMLTLTYKFRSTTT